MTLFDPDVGRTGRDEALARVEEAAPEEWKVEARIALRLRVLTGESFTTDDLWADLEARGVAPPREPRALGAVVMAERRKGRIARVGWTTTKRPSAHARPIPIWKSTR